jgi:hypothetical protein
MFYNVLYRVEFKVKSVIKSLLDTDSVWRIQYTMCRRDEMRCDAKSKARAGENQLIESRASDANY